VKASEQRDSSLNSSVSFVDIVGLRSAGSFAADANASWPRTLHVSIDHDLVFQHQERINDLPSHRYLRHHESILKAFG
jgi:hypothetical protein